MAKESFAEVAKNFLLLLPKGEYTRDELVSKFNMILQVADIESKDSGNRLSTVIYRLRKSGILTLEIVRKNNACTYKKL